MKRYYFDANATTPLAKVVCRFLRISDRCGNPASLHGHGRMARRALESARGKVADLLSCRPDEVIFNSGATEGNNTVLASAWETRAPGRDAIVVSAVEHDSVMRPLERLARRGAVIRQVPVRPDGSLDEQDFARAVDDKTALVSMMLANNETGFVFPIQRLAAVASKTGALFHVDAACALGKIPVSFSQLGVDFLTGSGHKFYGPLGTGFILKKQGVPFEPLLTGGTQERGQRAGTVNAPGMEGLALALEYALEGLSSEITRQENLRRQWLHGLKTLKPDLTVHESAHQLSGTLNVAFPGISNELLTAALDLEGVSVSTGSACHSGAGESSRILLAMGISKEEADSTIRISFGKMTTEKEVAGALTCFKKVLARM